MRNNCIETVDPLYLTSDQGLGEYSIEASVPSPGINVLCANMSTDEMSPMVYSAKWPSFNGTIPNATSWYVYSFLGLNLHLKEGCADFRHV